MIECKAYIFHWAIFSRVGVNNTTYFVLGTFEIMFTHTNIIFEKRCLNNHQT